MQFDDLENAVFLDGEALIEDPDLAGLARRRIAPLVGQAALDRTAGENAPARVLYEALWCGRSIYLIEVRGKTPPSILPDGAAVVQDFGRIFPVIKRPKLHDKSGLKACNDAMGQLCLPQIPSEADTADT